MTHQREGSAASGNPPHPDATSTKPKRSSLRIPRWLDFVFLGAGIGLLIYVVAGYPLAEMAHVCWQSLPALLATVVVALGWQLCNTRALGILLENRVGFFRLFWNRLVGDGYNNLLPLAGLGGEPFKVRHLTRFMEADKVLAALLRARGFETAMGLLVNTGSVILTLGVYPLPGAMRSVLVVFVIVAPLAALLSASASASRLPVRIGRAVSAWLGMHAAADAGVAVQQERPALPRPRTVWTRTQVGRGVRVASWLFIGKLLGFLEIGLILKQLGLGVDPLAIVFIDSVLNLSGYIGFLVPQGLGVLEGTSVFVFGLLGYPGVLAVAFSLVRRGRLLLVSLLGVGLHLAARRRVRGRPQSQELWEQQFRTGHWDYLDSDRELDHYAVLAGYIQHLTDERARLLDVGCGHGRLLRMVRGCPFACYVALDVSENAVARTLALGVPRVEGVVADFEGWAIQTPFNIIIFNESLYYARDPEGVLLRYSKYLTEDGVIVVSIRQKWKNRSVWRSIERSFEARHRCCVTNVHRETWDVRVLTPRVPGQGPSPLQVPALA